jgi:hypothetical protein
MSCNVSIFGIEYKKRGEVRIRSRGRESVCLYARRCAKRGGTYSAHRSCRCYFEEFGHDIPAPTTEGTPLMVAMSHMGHFDMMYTSRLPYQMQSESLRFHWCHSGHSKSKTFALLSLPTRSAGLSRSGIAERDMTKVAQQRRT